MDVNEFISVSFDEIYGWQTAKMHRFRAEQKLPADNGIRNELICHT